MNTQIATVKISSSKGFGNAFTGRGNSSAVALINEDGLFGFLKGENEPYKPIGGRKALIEVYKMDCIEFKPYSFGKGYSFGNPCLIK